jgi:dihydroanticapsin dehydrogenase
MRGLEHLTALVTGGATGIGAAIAVRLLEEGANVFLVDRDQAALGQAPALFNNYDDKRIRIVEYDISRECDRSACISEAIEWHGSCDVLVNNAAAFIIKGIDASVAQWQEVFDTNVIACARLGHLMSLGRFRGPNRAIVNIGSVNATHAHYRAATYNASKGALLTLTKCMALDLAANGIRVNCVSPGTIWTENNASNVQREFGIGRADADMHPTLGHKHALKRLGNPSEVASAVCFLASNDASFITGANLYVDGGYSIL